MAEKFTPEEVARLDPFGVRQISASEKLREFLEANQPEAPKPKEFEADLIRAEKEAWQKVLGSPVEVSPLPASVTKEAIGNLEKLGLELRFIPALNVNQSTLRQENVDEFLQELTRRYPSWKSYESLNDQEKSNPAVVRNLREWYWGKIKEGKIDFPSLPGAWLAVETLKKPAWGEKYPPSPVTNLLGLSDRFNISWNQAVGVGKDKKRNILGKAGFSGRAEIRLLETLEWNLLANREGWGKTNSYEWTNTEYRESGSSSRLIVGHSGSGGAAYVYWLHPDDAGGSVGFRFAVVFGP